MIDIIHAMHPLPDERKHAVDLLNKYGMIELFEKAKHDFSIAFADCKGKNNILIDLSIHRITENLLTNINETVGQISDLNEKKVLKALLGKLGNHLLDHTITPNLSKPALGQLKNHVKTFFEKKNYSIADLTLYINMEQDANRDMPNEVVGFFKWIVAPEKQDEFEIMMEHRDLIKSKKELRHKFKPDQAHKQIRFNLEERDFILVLFQELVANKVILCKGTRGVFSILNQGAKDFNGKKFMKRAPKRYMEQINKDPETYSKLKRRAELIIRDIKRIE